MLPLALTSAPLRAEQELRGSAQVRLAQVPTGAIVITPGDATISVLWYLHHVEGIRPDIIVVDQNMFQFSWYRERLQRDFPELRVPEADDLDLFVTSNWLPRPVCWLSLIESRAPGCLPQNREAIFD